MKKTLFVGLSLLFAAGIWAADQRPNIVVIMTDDSGYTDLGCYGGEIDTPNLDKLAALGVRLSNFYSNGRYSPTRASLLWEGGTKTHFIALWPGRIKPGAISHEQAWVGDILPTCLELAGTEYPESFRGKATGPLDGRTMLDVLEGRKREAAEYLFFNDKGQQSVICQGRWKLLIEPGWHSLTSKKPGINYDLKTDPSEQNDIADSKPEMVQMLAKKCDAWIAEMGIVEFGELLKIRPGDNK